MNLLDRIKKRFSQEGRRCPTCGAQVSDSARTCLMCGARLPARKRGTASAAVQPTTTVRSPRQGRTTCPHCGAPVSRTAQVCSVCEQPLSIRRQGQKASGSAVVQIEATQTRRQARKACPKCGARVSAGAAICPICGIDLHRAALAQAVQTTSPTTPPASEQPTPKSDLSAAEGRPLCPNCHTPISRTARQCTVCGANLAQPEPAMPPAPQVESAARPETRPAIRVRRWYQNIWIWILAAGLLIVAGVGRSHLSRWPLFSPNPTPTPTWTPIVIPHTYTPQVSPTTPPTPTPTPTRVSTATPTVTPTATEMPTATPIVHVVKMGDTWFGIARLYGVTPDELARVNNLTTRSTLHPGDQLMVPAQGHAPPSDQIIHIVQASETLADIALRYGVSQERIRETNSMGPNERVQAGDRIVVPMNPTPTPTFTVTPTATPTPGPAFVAPPLLYPPQDAQFEGDDATILLQWASVGLLQNDEQYALTLRYLGQRGGGQANEITIYTQVTSWRVPAEWYPGPDVGERRFEWTVTVVQQSDQKPPLLLSAEGEKRIFAWK